MTPEETAEFDAWKAERNRILRELDVDAAMKQANFKSRQFALVGLHKARYECLDIPDELRLESQRWLAERKFHRMYGEPVKVGDPLPI